jgi:hypothetical protein
MKVLNVCQRRFERLVVLSGARRDPLFNEPSDALDEQLLFLAKAKVHADISLV